MDFLEVIGGIKAENVSFKSEEPKNVETDIVEIKAEDVQDAIKKEPGEDAEPIIPTDNIETNSRGIQVQKTDTKNKIHNTKSKGKKSGQGGGKSQTDLTRKETVKEILIINYKKFNVKEKISSNKSKVTVKKKSLKKSEEYSSPKTQKRLRNNDKKTQFAISKHEYSRVEKDGRYYCSHCQTFTTSKKDILKHIRDRHRDSVIFDNRKEKLKKLVTTIKSRYVAWYEYTLEGKDQYRCSHCQILINGQKQVFLHVQSKHRMFKRDKFTQCPYCPYQTRYGDINSHILFRHTDEKDINYFRCDQCEYKAKLKSGIRRHILERHTDANYLNKLNRMHKCLQCPKMFKTISELRRHELLVHNADSVVKLNCFNCPYKCKSKNALVNHMQRHHINLEKLQTLQCPRCPFKTKFKYAMLPHFNRKHLKIPKIVQCHICSYQCKDIPHLNLHLIGHKKEKDEKDLKYRCDICDYKTYRLYSLQSHKLSHLKPEEIKYFFCYHCNFKAKRKDNLKSHIYRHYRKEHLFQCYICDFSTKKKDQLIRHITKHSKDLKNVKKPKAEVILPTEQPVPEKMVN